MNGALTASAPALIPTAPPGACCGYQVDASLAFRFIRTGTGLPLAIRETDEPVPIGEPMMAWPATPEYPHAVTLAKRGPTFTLQADELGWYQVNPSASSIVMSAAMEPIRREVGLWGIPVALCALHQGGMAIHAAAVELDGSAILLAAPGHFGKTTLAAACVRSGHRVLGEDFIVLRPGPPPVVLPGPAVLRLRNDVFHRLQIPDTGVVLNSMGRVFLALDQHRRGDGRPVPLGAVVFLRNATGTLRLSRAAPAEALRDLWSLSFMLPTDADRAQSFRLLGGLVGAVPVWNLYRPLEFEWLGRAVESLSSICR
jgi:hypothetical protein